LGLLTVLLIEHMNEYTPEGNQGYGQQPVSPTPMAQPQYTQPAPQEIPPQQIPQPQQEEPKKKHSFVKILLVLIVLLVLGGIAFAFLAGNDDMDDYSYSTTTTGTKQTSGNTVAIDAPAGCEATYNQLLEANAFDFSKCEDTAIRSGQYAAEDTVAKTNLVLVFDASGSMAGQVDGKAKIDIAKEAAKDFVDTIAGEGGINLSFVVYGHKGGNTEAEKATSCVGIEEVIPLGTVNATQAKQQIDSFSATGWTPIADSLLKAKNILLAKQAENNIILLVSDGEETCGGSPVSVVQSLKAGDPSITTSVIGFDVAGEDEAQLQSIANAGGGDYYSVKNALDLQEAFNQYNQMLDEADFTIGRVIEEVYDIGYVTNTYNQCMMGLKREQAAMMLDIHASELVGTECVTYADAMYTQRYNGLEQAILKQYTNNKNTFKTLQ